MLAGFIKDLSQPLLIYIVFVDILSLCCKIGLLLGMIIGFGSKTVLDLSDAASR